MVKTLLSLFQTLTNSKQLSLLIQQLFPSSTLSSEMLNTVAGTMMAEVKIEFISFEKMNQNNLKNY